MTLTISGTTRLFGILADPVHHVKTPQGINRLFDAAGIDAVMVPLHVAPDGLAPLVQGLRCLHNLDGFVVTVPHKAAMLGLCDALTPTARRIGAVNVVHRTARGQLLGDMLDGEGFVAGLRRAGIEPSGRSAYLAGAGGAASAIAFALASAGVRQLTVANRSADKVRELLARIAAEFPSVALATGSRDPSGHDLVINATSLGLRPGDALPLEASALTPDQTVAEIIMQPAVTPLLAAAEARGCRVHGGAPMLQCQLEFMARFMRSGSAR
jgi:shikimate dehydrogenase